MHPFQPSAGQEEKILRSAERKVRLGFTLGLACLALVGGISYFSLVRVHRERASVDHTHHVITSMRRVLWTLSDAEASARGYIISGREEFLEPYRNAARDVGTELQTLRTLTADNAVQQRRLDTLAPLVAERLLVLQEGITVRRAEGLAAVQQQLASGRGKQLQDRIRGMVAEMEVTERSLLQERAARSRRADTVARTEILGGLTLALAFMLVSLSEIGRDFAGSRRAQTALQGARDQLETRVQERTAELAKATADSMSSEALLEGVINSAMDAIITVDEQQKIVIFNPAAEQMFHCPATDALGQSLDQFIPESFRSAHAQHVREFGETKVTRRQMGNLGSIAGLRVNGQQFPIEASISQVRVGERRLFTAIVRDITERKAAEEALRSRSARFRSLIENSVDGITVLNAEGKIVYASPPAEQMLGYRPGEMVGDRVLDLLHPEDRERYLAVRQTTLESSRPAPARFRMRHKNGSWQIIESIRSNQLDNADVRGVVVNSRNVTELVQTEETLRRQAVLFEQTYDAVFVWEWNGPITFWNRAAERLYGYSREEAVGRIAHELLQTRTLGSEVPFSVPLERDGNWEGELEHTTRDCRRMTVDSRMALVRDEEHAYVLETTRDVTERKRAQEEIQLLNEDLERRVTQRTAELQAANKELESFSYSVAHDLRAPLRAVDGFSDAVLEDYGPQLPEEARKYLQTIRGGAQRMGRLIDDLLAFSRLNRQALSKQPVDMESLVRGVLEDAIPEGQEKNIQIVNGNLPAAYGDPSLLRQVWANLLSNAIKYSRHAEQARIEISAIEEPQRNVYFVRDNGAGFDMKYADKLFGVFQRLHRADEFEGTGIGLAIVQRVIHRHGGRVWAEAKVNEGATFYFTVEGGT